MEVKQVIIIRKDLKVRKGKMFAQAAHAVVDIFINAATIDSNTVTTATGGGSWKVEKTEFLKIPITEELDIWIKNNRTKIVVGVDSLEELLKVYAEAKEDKLPASLLQDIGKTEFKEPTYTAVAIGPCYSEMVDRITGHLKLL